MKYIVFDLEYNQHYNFKTGEKSVLVAECPFEIIQIGAVKLDENFEIIDNFSFLIKPSIYKRIHPVVEKITGFTEETFRNCKGFRAAFDAFCTFMGKEECVLCSWGPDDIKYLFKNMLYYNCDHSKVSKLYINAQQYASKVLNTQAGNSIGLKTAVEALGLEVDETFHDAFNDALYTAKVFKQVHPDMITPSVFNVESITPKKPVATKMNTRALLEYFEKSLERKLTPEEAAIIRTAYKFGKNQTFEHKPR
ncbi:MAG: exonuclease domain-containing protein [Firmicutes bacterium]|nr:exonuclease domain-containing protein [Bacillota bacterium]